MATRDEIRQNAYKLEAAGASTSEIDEYVSLASKSISEPSSQTQESNLKLPEGTTQNAMNRVLGTAKGIPLEMAPAIVGGMLGAGVGSVPLAMALSGIGAAGGEAYRQLGQRTGVFPGEPPKTSGEALKKIGVGGALGAGGELAGRGVAAGLGKIFAPFKNSVTPEIQAQAKSAAELGVEPPLRNITENRALQAMDRTAEFAPFGLGQRVTNIVNAANRKFEEATNALSKTIGKEMPPIFLSSRVDQLMKTHEAGYKMVRNKLYDAADKLIKDVVPETSNTIQAAKDIIERQSGSIEPSGLSKVKEILNDLLPQKTGIPSILTPETASNVQNFSQLKQLRSRLGQLIKDGFSDPATTGIKSELKYLYSAMSKDLDSTAAKISPEFASAIENADKVYASGLNFFKDKLLKGLQNQAAKNPSQLWTVAIKQSSPEIVDSARKILGDDVFKTVQTQWFDDVLSKSYSEIEGARVLSPKKLLNNLGKYGEVLPNIFADRPEILSQLTKITDTARLLTRGEKVAAGSQTAFINQMYNLLMEVPRMISSGLAGTAMGRKYVTTGIESAIPQLAGKATRAISGVSAKVNQDE